MELPELTRKNTSVLSVTDFRGLDRHPTAPLGWAQRDENLCSDEHPMLTVRPPRGLYKKPDGMGAVSGGVVIEDRLCVVDGTALWIGDERVDMELEAGEKLLLPYSYYLLIWPDKVYVNVLNIEDNGRMDGRTRVTASMYSPWSIDLCDDEGRACGHFAEVEPSHVTHGMLWCKPSYVNHEGETVPAKLYRASISIVENPEEEGGSGEPLEQITWTEVESYIKVKTSYETVECAEKGEYIRFQGISDNTVYDILNDQEVMGSTLLALEGFHVVSSVEFVEKDGKKCMRSFSFRGILEEEAINLRSTDEETLTIERAVPELDCAVVSEGRVYGAYRGVSSISGETVNELYISAAGDFRRFYRVEDTTADPLVMSVAEPGEFRGAAVVGGVVTFFKDGRILTVGGSTPESFYIHASEGRSPSAGCEGSLSVVDGYAYYLSAGEVVTYYSGSTSIVSDKLGTSLLGVRAAVAGAYGHKYYLAVSRPNGRQEILVLDTLTGLWHAERPPQGGVAAFAGHTSGTYLFDRMGGIWTVTPHESGHADMGGAVDRRERERPWLWESGMIGLDTPEKKYILKAEVRLLLREGSTAEMWVQYDSDPLWRSVWLFEAGPTRTVLSRMLPHRCDHVRIRLAGRGAATLLGLFLTMEKESGR